MSDDVVTTTFDIFGHVLPDKDDSWKAVMECLGNLYNTYNQSNTPAIDDAVERDLIDLMEAYNRWLA